MDLLRATIKGLFYDVDPEEALTTLRDSNQGTPIETLLIDPLISRLKATKTNYAPESIDSLRDFILNEWLDIHNRKTQCNSYYGYVMNSLRYFAENSLDLTNNEPTVNFDKLLRWKDLTLYIGEDILIASAYAKNSKPLDDYEWVSPIAHNDVNFNEFWNNRAFCDVHFHVNGSFDSADISWIYNMNHPEHKSSHIVLASWIRYYLFRYVNGQIEASEVKTALDSYVNGITDPVTDIHTLTSSIDAEWDKQDSGVTFAKIKHWDYATQDHSEKLSVLFQGERLLLHQLLKRVFTGSKNDRKLYGFIYLYIITKIDHRKGYVQCKKIQGLGYYKNYYHKIEDLAKDWLDTDMLYRYTMQSILRPNTEDILEVRMSSAMADTIKNEQIKYTKSVIGEQTELQYGNSMAIRHIINIIKPCEELGRANRYTLIRASMQESVMEALSTIEQINKIAMDDENLNSANTVPVCGLDTASSDLRVNPAVLSPFLRFAIERGVPNITYHIAEEYRDILDGLRMVYEYITFVATPSKMRLGHASVLGIDPFSYYLRIDHNIICSRLCLIDNLVWFIMYAKACNKPLEKEIEEDFLTIVISNFEVAYGKEIPFDLEEYWLSMHLRGDLDVRNIELRGCDDEWVRCGKCNHELACRARENEAAKALNEKYEELDHKAFESVLYRMPSSAISSILVIQSKMLEKIKQNECMIESCPTSNLIIGPFERYRELPIRKFADDPDLNVSINTDTKSIFATSLYDEYSLMAVSMKKDGKDMKDDIIPLLNNLADNGKKQLFEPFRLS